MKINIRLDETVLAENLVYGTVESPFYKKRIEWLENYTRCSNNNNNHKYSEDLKAVKQKLADPLEADANR
jgi:hypothetical protein